MNPKQMTFVLVGVLTLLVAAGLAGFWFAHQDLEDKAQELSEVLADTTLVNDQLASYSQLEAEYESIQPLEDQVYDVLPTDKRQAEVTLQLNRIVNEAGLELRGLSFESTADQPGEQSQTVTSDIPGVLVMPVSFQITSGYREFVALLQTLENHQRHMQVSNLSISRGEDQHNFNIDLEVFLQP